MTSAITATATAAPEGQFSRMSAQLLGMRNWELTAALTFMARLPAQTHLGVLKQAYTGSMKLCPNTRAQAEIACNYFAHQQQANPSDKSAKIELGVWKVVAHMRAKTELAELRASYAPGKGGFTEEALVMLQQKFSDTSPADAPEREATYSRIAARCAGIHSEAFNEWAQAMADAGVSFTN